MTPEHHDRDTAGHSAQPVGCRAVTESPTPRRRSAPRRRPQPRRQAPHNSSTSSVRRHARAGRGRGDDATHASASGVAPGRVARHTDSGASDVGGTAVQASFVVPHTPSSRICWFGSAICQPQPGARSPEPSMPPGTSPHSRRATPAPWWIHDVSAVLRTNCAARVGATCSSSTVRPTSISRVPSGKRAVPATTARSPRTTSIELQA